MILGGLLHLEVEGRKIPSQKSESIYPAIHGNITENFVIINTAVKSPNVTRSYPELKKRLQGKN